MVATLASDLGLELGRNLGVGLQELLRPFAALT